MKITITNAITKILRERMRQMLLAGCFPEVHYQEGKHNGNGIGFTTYIMNEYAINWARFVKVADNRMKVELDPSLGVWTRKHSAAFLQSVTDLVGKITEADVVASPERLRTIFD